MATSNYTRIPEMVCLGDVFKTDPIDQAQIFNDFFQQQFSEPSRYDILVEYGPPDEWHINFDPTPVLVILKNLNPKND